MSIFGEYNLPDEELPGQLRFWAKSGQVRGLIAVLMVKAAEEIERLERVDNPERTAIDSPSETAK